MFFNNLRRTEWNPTFEWVKTAQEAADKINCYHEDYPKYVDITDWVLGLLPSADNKIYRTSLVLIHELIFADKSFAGEFRTCNVIVGIHRPPEKEDVEYLMAKLEESYTVKDIDDLIEWYKDFETIHPFQDGNGRVGGVIVASYSHKLYPQKGWLAPNQ